MDEMHLCVCCLRCPPDKDLTTPYTHDDNTEIYSDILQDCFNIQMVLDGWRSCGICSSCAGRLRDASDFKLQVQRCQAELRARMLDRSHVKVEEPDAELPVTHEEESSCVLQELLRPGLAVADGDGASDDEESPVKLEMITVDEADLYEEPAVKAEVSAGAASDEDRPAQELLRPGLAVADGDGASDDEESPVKLEMITVDEADLYEEPAVKAEVSAGAASDEDRPAHASAITGAESSVQLRARRQLAVRPPLPPPPLYWYRDYKCSRKSHFKTHQRIHTGEEPFKCGFCDYVCNDRENLQKHQRIHTKEKPFKCGYCDYECSVKSTLLTHQRIHTGEKPFKCGNCDYESSVKSNFNRHRRIHTGEKPFECGSCDYKCSLKSNLQMHQRLHTGEKPFECGYCDYKFKQKSHLKKHERTHTGEKKPFNCG